MRLKRLSTVQRLGAVLAAGLLLASAQQAATRADDTPAAVSDDTVKVDKHTESVINGALNISLPSNSLMAPGTATRTTPWAANGPSP